MKNWKLNKIDNINSSITLTVHGLNEKLYLKTLKSIQTKWFIDICEKS